MIHVKILLRHALGRLRRIAERILPRIAPPRLSSMLLAIGDRHAQYLRYKRSGVPAATKIIAAELGLTVQSGPFRGMSYPASAAYSRHAIPKLLGCYEKELHGAISRRLVDVSYRRFVDIGAAEGYYTVGFAFRAKRPVYAFEIEPFETRYVRLMARLNQVEEIVHLHGWCSSEKLRSICPDRSLIFCDCEGYEV